MTKASSTRRIASWTRGRSARHQGDRDGPADPRHPRGALRPQAAAVPDPELQDADPAARRTRTRSTSTPCRPGSWRACGSRSRTWTWTTARSSTTPAARSCRRSRCRTSGVEADYSQYLHYEEYIRRWSSRARHGDRRTAHQEGPGVDLVGEPAARRAHREGPEPHPQEPGHPLLLRGHALLHAADVEGPHTEEGIFWREPEWIPTSTF